MNRYSILFLLLLIPAITNAQGLHGTLKDEAGAAIPGASVLLMFRNDSTLVTFATSDKDGKFSMHKQSHGKYILQISILGFTTYYKNIDWETDDISLDDIVLKEKSTQLKEAQVTTDRIPIKIKKDTIEYNANAFKTRPNAVVEDLLKKLPGVEVEKDGTIKAQGKQVNKVLVDGKEFFGDDPKMATRNLPADAVNNVQVYDKKSDAAEFTGIDDGQRDKTINLNLKDDKKQGVFGKVRGGYGSDDRYDGSANINRFGKSSQMSILAMSNNINTQGFTFNDYLNFMGGLKNLSGGESGRITLNPQDIGIPLGDDASTNGFMTTTAGGLNYNRDLSKKTELRSSYFYNRTNTVIDDDITRQSIIGPTSFTTKENDAKNTLNEGNKLNLVLKHKPDSAKQIIWRAGFNTLDETGTSAVNSQSYDVSGSQLNAQNTKNAVDNIANKFNTTLSYLQKLSRTGRNLALTVSANGADGTNNTTLNSVTHFFSKSDSAINQQQNFHTKQLSYTGKISYTEPIGKHKYLEFNVSHSSNENSLDKKYYDINGSSETFNSALSNVFDDVFRYNKFGTNLKFTPSKQSIIAGVAYQQADLVTTYNSSSMKREYYNVLPNASWMTEIAPTKNLALYYTTSINAPTGQQLQPVQNNTDPLNIYVGNPDLKPEYNHSLNLNYNSFDQFNFRSFFVGADANYTENKITYEQSISKDLVQTNKPVNVDHDITAEGYTMFSTPLRVIRSKINSSLNSTFNRGIMYLNALKNDVNRYVNTIDINIENVRQEKIDAVTGVKLIHNLSQYSINKDQNQNFLNRVYYADLTYYAPRAFTANASLDYTIYQGNAFGATQEIPIIKAFVSKQFLKNKRGELKLSVTDLLNKNRGISRTSSFNYIQDQQIHTIGRYVMLTFTYSLSKFGGNGRGMNIQMK